MEQIVLIVHLLVALAIIGLIMLQQGKGADMGASFGAGASQTLFGSDGSGNVLTRATSWLAALFFASSFYFNLCQHFDGKFSIRHLCMRLVVIEWTNEKVFQKMWIFKC